MVTINLATMAALIRTGTIFSDRRDFATRHVARAFIHNESVKKMD